MSKLFSELTVGGVTFANRAWVSPMCQYSADNGLANSWHQAHYGAFAQGGAGLVMVEATGVSPVGRISVGCLGIWSDEHAQALAPIVDFVHSCGAKIGIQLAHAGRKGGTTRPWDGGKFSNDEGWQTIAPSAVAFGAFPTPRAMTDQDIAEIKQEFVAAAQRAVATGFDVIEVHSAHGYLLHEFLSPLSNQRIDEYGGALENRMRLLIEVVTSVRKVVPADRALFVRISATDWAPGGFNGDEAVAVAKQLKLAGADFIDCSTGGLVPDAVIPVGPGYQVSFAADIEAQAEIPTSAVGAITTGSQAEAILNDSSVSAVMIGRAMLGNPHWTYAAAKELGESVPWQNQYLRGVI